VYSWLERLQSLRHRFSYGMSERLRISRGVFHETPAEELPDLPPQRIERIAALQRRYGVRFEETLNAASSLNNYEYLDILDRAWSAAAREPSRSASPAGVPTGGLVSDVGCASFYYAAALSAFFRPHRLIGVEVEGHRLFKNGHSRADHARGYVDRVPNAEFVIADYAVHACRADVITAWYPFLTPHAILAWRLPLSLLRPAALFERIRANLNAGGRLFMVNHGTRESETAHRLCDAVGLALLWQGAATSVLGSHRLEPPIASIWRIKGDP
jgi:hypothetical protein